MVTTIVCLTCGVDLESEEDDCDCEVTRTVAVISTDEDVEFVAQEALVDVD